MRVEKAKKINLGNKSMMDKTSHHAFICNYFKLLNNHYIYCIKIDNHMRGAS